MRSRISRIAILTAVCLVVGALAAEAALRIFMPQALVWDIAATWEPVEGLGWRNRPDVNVMVNTGERDVHFITDRFGHRIGSSSQPAGDLRILAVGDSFVQSLQVEYEQTMTALLAGSLSEEVHRHVEVVNAGVGGYDPNQYLGVVRDELRHSKFDFVLVFVYLENDIVEKRVDSLPPSKRVVSPRLELSMNARKSFSSLRTVLHAWSMQHSHAYVFAYNISQLYAMRAGERAGFMSNVMLANAESPMWATTAEILSDIAQTGNGAGARVACVLLPPNHYIDERALAQSVNAVGLKASQLDVGQPARLLSMEAARRGLTVWDSTPALKRAWDQGQHDLYGRVDRHLAPGGHRVIAEFLGPLVLAELSKEL